MIGAPSQSGQAEEQVEPERRAQVLGDVGGDAGQDDGHAGDPDDRPRQMGTHVRRQGPPRDDAQLGRQVLQEDEHERAERDDPEQVVAELGATGDVRRPVARIDETDGDDEAGSEVAQQLAREEVTEESARRWDGGRAHGRLSEAVCQAGPSLAATLPQPTVRDAAGAVSSQPGSGE